MTETAQLALIQAILYISTAIIAVWRIERVGKTTERAVQTSQETKTAVEQVGKTAAKVVRSNEENKTEIIAGNAMTDQLNGRFNELAIKLEERNTASVNAALVVIEKQNRESIQDRAEMHSKHEELRGMVVTLKSTVDKILDGVNGFKPHPEQSEGHT